MKQPNDASNPGECKQARKEPFSSMSDDSFMDANASSVELRQKLVNHWAKTTSMHGIGKLADDEIEAPSLGTRLFWAFLLMCSLALLAYQVSQLIIKYSDYPVSTRRYVEDVPSVQFPAITICPINGFSNHRLEERYPAVSKVVDHIFNAALTANASFEAVSATANMTCEEKWRRVTSNVPSKDFFKTGTFYMAANSLNNSMLADVSTRLQDILIDCAFYGMQCAPRDFTVFRNAAFGFCYTFNLNDNRSAMAYGPMNSLQMTLALNQSDYVDNGYGDAGYRILIHEPNTYPFAEAAGYHLSPGTSVQIGLSFYRYETQPPPYGECRDYTDAENLALNAYATSASIPSLWGCSNRSARVGYSHQACLRSCKQRAAIGKCGCLLPCSHATDAQRNALRVCEIRQPVIQAAPANSSVGISASCVVHAYATDCTQQCKFPCTRWAYTAGISFGQFPSQAYLPRLVELATVGGHAADIARARRNNSLMEFARSNFLRVNVFAEEIKLHATEDSPSYQLKDLLSDCGGQAGFWLGLSVLTVFEFVDLLTRLCRAAFLNTGGMGS